MAAPTDDIKAFIPDKKGTYALLLCLGDERVIQVGKLGSFPFPAGYYLYTGSAFGPGGLAGRLGRHLAQRRAGRCHWHIDYLRRWASIVAIWFAEHKAPREHDWATQAGRLTGSSCPAPRFGASDCRCPSHLFGFVRRPDASHFAAALALSLPGDGPLQTIETGAENSPS